MARFALLGRCLIASHGGHGCARASRWQHCAGKSGTCREGSGGCACCEARAVGLRSRKPLASHCCAFFARVGSEASAEWCGACRQAVGGPTGGCGLGNSQSDTRGGVFVSVKDQVLAGRYVVEDKLFHWVFAQNTEHGVAPSRSQLVEQALMCVPRQAACPTVRQATLVPGPLGSNVLPVEQMTCPRRVEAPLLTVVGKQVIAQVEMFGVLCAGLG